MSNHECSIPRQEIKPKASEGSCLKKEKKKEVRVVLSFPLYECLHYAKEPTCPAFCTLYVCTICRQVQRHLLRTYFDTFLPVGKAGILGSLETIFCQATENM